MTQSKLSSPGVLLIAAAVTAGGIYLLDLYVLEPRAVSQKTLALQEQATRAAGAATSILRAEENRLLTMCRMLARREEAGTRLDHDNLSRHAAGLADVDAAWMTDGAGRVLGTWRRGGQKLLPAVVRRSLTRPVSDDTSVEIPHEAPASGLLFLGGEVVLFARSTIGWEGGSQTATQLYLARRLGPDLLAKIGSVIPGELILVRSAEQPKGILGSDPSQPAIWLLPNGRLGAAWPARDTWGRDLGYFSAHIAASRILAHASSTRRTILIVLSLSAVTMLLIILGASVFLAGPMSRLVRRLQRVESGTFAIEDMTRGLRGEPLLLATKLQSALMAMSQLSKTDEMTGLANRRQFDEGLHRAFHQARRHGRPLSVMVMDIDLFKAINDTKGHQAGDEVIKVVANIIKRCCRQSDLPARPGGDEFAVLLPETTTAAAAVVAERIRKTVFDRTILIHGSEVAMTVSIGIADLEAGRTETPEDLVALADEALYAAKQLGRNRFVQAHEIEQDEWVAGGEEGDRVEMLRNKLAGLDTQFKSLFVRALQEIVQVMEGRDPTMADRARKVQHYASLIGRQLNLSEDLIKQIELASLVHDIGMLALPDSVALCQGRLSEEQTEAMRRHTLVGAKILDGTEFLEQAVPVARFHHEWFDSTGYPDGLSGLGIPPICRIVAVADAFNAMTSQRPFRDKMSIQEAFEELRRHAGKQFDPDMVEAFVAGASKLGEKLTDVPLPKASGAERPPADETPAEAPSKELTPVG